MADLADILLAIEAVDLNYAIRNQLVHQAVAEARALGMAAGYGWDDADTAIPGYRAVAYIDLPTGPGGRPRQVSWHLASYDADWDGHTTEQKYQRIRAYAEGVGRG